MCIDNRHLPTIFKIKLYDQGRMPTIHTLDRYDQL